jgi:short-subunit dehydrogenase
MKLEHSRIVLTGAAGGIGRALALSLAQAGASLALAGRRRDALDALAAEARAAGAGAHVVVADIATAPGRAQVVEQATEALGGIDVLINNAGTLNFGPFEAEDPVLIERLFQANVLAPVLLTRALLPQLLGQGRGRIVNVGSTFGSIGFPFFASYSASKFALRGFSQALRRELAGTGIGVTYVAPRATRTDFNPANVQRMNQALKNKEDTPAQVAAAIIEALRRERDEVYLGWPEKLFVRLNALLPRMVDKALRKQQADMRRFAADN